MSNKRKHNGKNKRSSKAKFRNPHYSPRKKLPARSNRHIEAKFFATRNGGIAFRVLRSIDSEGGEQLRFDESEKLYIDSRHTCGAVNGDIVLLKVISGHDARVEEIVTRAITELIGILVAAEDEDGELVWVVEPDDTKLKFAVIISEDRSGSELHDGDKVLVLITDYPDGDYPDAEGIIIRNYGDSESKSANYRAILEKHSVITDFSDTAFSEAERRASETVCADGRVDLRSERIFTLDGADAKDLDDAISVKKRGNNRVLGVHIADVSHYVRAGSALDREAMARGTSIYFADRVVPMLPVALSNGICSLNAGVDRLTLTAEMEIDSEGNIISTSVYRSVINSKLRGVYSEFNSLISGDITEELKEKYAVISEDIPELLALYEILKRKSLSRGSLDLETTEAAVILDENGEPIDITARVRGIGEMLIEQFMLAANEAVATKMTKLGLPCVYRVHAQPDGDKLSAFVNFTHNLDLKPGYVKRGAKLSATYFSGILDRAKERGLGTVVSYVLLRTMMKARYSSENSSHFGLGSDCYCHFTSPIRRYPDLSVHRIINAAIDSLGTGAYLSNSNYAAVASKYRGFAANSAESSSECELKALAVEREMDDLFRVLYMSKRVGEEYDATVSSVTSFGMFCTLPNTCEGLVPIRTLDGHFEFNETSMSLESFNKTYKLGDLVRVRVEDVSVPMLRIDLTVI